MILKSIDFCCDLLYNHNMKRKKNKAKKQFLTETSKVITPSDNTSVTIDNLNLDIANKYLAYKNYESLLRNKLLGKFDTKGQYIIEKNIKNDLTWVRKTMQRMTEKVIYCDSIIASNDLKFEIEYDISETYCNATLIFVETEYGAELDKKYRTPLDSFIEPYSPKFIEHVKERWNIDRVEDQYSKELSNLEALLLALLSAYEFNKELIEILSQIYVLRMTAFLATAGEVGQNLLAKYKLVVQQKLENNPSITQDYSFLKRILDEVFVKFNAIPLLLSKNEKEVGEILKNFYEPLERIKNRDKVVIGKSEKEEIKEDKPKKKEEPKKSKAKGGKTESVGTYKINGLFSGGQIQNLKQNKGKAELTLEEPKKLNEEKKEEVKPKGAKAISSETLVAYNDLDEMCSKDGSFVDQGKYIEERPLNAEFSIKQKNKIEDINELLK